jgi:ssRNA-specific RNase YbeY (16S rRNA maturation enzyme)
MLNTTSTRPAVPAVLEHPLVAGRPIDRRAFLGLLGLFLAGCTPMNAEPLPKSAPLVLGIGYDITASTRDLPIPTEEQLDELISVVKSRGGIVAFGLIADKIEPLTRLEVAPVAGRLDERARAAQKNRKTVAEWKERVAAKLARPRNVQVTDFYGFTRQMDTLFRERTIPESAVKVLLLSSDAVHTAKRNPRAQALPTDVTVLAIGVERPLGDKLFGERILYFEDIASAIKMLRTLTDTRPKEA